MLPFDIGQIGLCGIFRRPQRHRRLGRRQHFDTVQMRGHLSQRYGPERADTLQSRRLRRIFRRQYEGAPRPHSLPSHSQRTAHRPEHAGQRQFAGKFVSVQLVRRHLTRSRQNTDRYRQIETARLFGQIGRGQIDGDFFSRKIKPALNNRRPHTVAAFLYLGIRQADDIECGQTVGQMGFHLHQRRVHAVQSPAVYKGKSHKSTS